MKGDVLKRFVSAGICWSCLSRCAITQNGQQSQNKDGFLSADKWPPNHPKGYEWSGQKKQWICKELDWVLGDQKKE
jgi:hypothetical protein